MIPNAQMSTFAVGVSMFITSGDLKAGVVSKPLVYCFIVYKSILDIPKSPILRIVIPSDNWSKKMLPGFISR